jgi:hypothetical protein
VETWDGASWLVAAMPAESAADNLTGISCISSEWCTAAGDRTTGPAVTQTLAEMSSDGIWGVTSTGNPSPSYSLLNGVSCGGSNTGGTFCIAVGYRATRNGGPMPLIESY